MCLHCACNLKKNLDWGERVFNLWMSWVLDRGFIGVKKKKRKEVKKEKIGDTIKFR